MTTLPVTFNRVPTAVAYLVLGLGLAVLPSVAEARVVVGIGLPFGWYGPPYSYGTPAYAYWPPPLPVYLAPSVQSALPPAPLGPPPTQYWYYCNKPQGYYPYVTTCSGAWRKVEPTPTR